MTLQARFGIGIVILAGTFAAICGCEDSAARQRHQVQKTVADLSRELKLAIAGGTSSTDADTVMAQQQKINGIVTRLAQVSGGEPGQQAAKAVLSATALRELANMKLVSAEQLESQHRADRVVLQSQVDAMSKLDGIASALSSVNASAQRDELQQGLDAAKARATELTEKISQLSGPIEERSTQNAANKKELEQLRLEVGQLQRKAQELGSADGFDTFRRSIDVNRQADKIEYDISQREIDLDYSLNPEHNLADAQLKQLQAMMQAIEATQQNLNKFAESTVADVNKTRTEINALGGQVKKGLININNESQGALKAAYDDAQASLEKAGSQLQAARGDDAAKLIAVRINETLGRMQWSKAQGLAEQQRLLQQLISIDKASAGSPLEGDLKSIGTAHDEAVEQAKAAFTLAKDAAAQLKGASDSPQLQAVQSNLQSSIDILSGKEPEPEPAAPAASTAAPARTSPPAAAPAGGFQTPEALIERMQAIAALPSASEQITAAFAISYAQTAEGKSMLSTMRDFASAITSLKSAMTAKFGAEATKAALGPIESIGGFPEVSADKISERTDDKVVIPITSKTGKSSKATLVKVDGKWFISADDAFLGAGDDDRQQTQMMAAKMPAIKAAVQRIAARIRSGEINSPQAAVMAFGQAMMGGGEGGMSGAPPGSPDANK